MRFSTAILACFGLAACSELGFHDGVANVSREGASVTTLTTSSDDGSTGTDDGSTATSHDDTGADADTGDDDDDDDDDDGGDDSGRADLPYDVRLEIGDTFVLTDAFLAEGPAPAAIVGVTMDDPQWRYAELTGLAPFTVDQTDCDHAGNRDTGRDRIEVTWQNADGSVETDHLDLRYCGA